MNRLKIFDKTNVEENILPMSIRHELVTKYLFNDMFTMFKKYFPDESIHNSQLLFDLAFGLVPR